ncbi:TlpA family protein disulfide reductase [Corynebacterium sp. YIM 101645]|uniref:TlpA family protein disulfide reductase n=1 Tax=Corynebacterium lemuris TaxID=1859292 RepID=A0ABT2FSV4_9CORY|nr:TlpA disulfide reductase family protein [Corynebacterium lemuris]MCS5478300.1 TlpA family protein disulfide reductase [Corynebacterium lemuris]
MNRQHTWTIIIGILLTVGVFAAAATMLRTVNGPAQDPQAVGTAGNAGDEGASQSNVPPRPDCPATGAGGVALDCLGGQTGEGAGEGITVVNVWAWWCGPCRDELPFFDEFAATHPEYTVVGVHADANPGNGAAMLGELGISLPSYQDDDNLFAGTLGLPGVIPLTLVFDGTEQLAMYPRTFQSVQELSEAVADAVEDT